MPYRGPEQYLVKMMPADDSDYLTLDIGRYKKWTRLEPSVRFAGINNPLLY
ncbi:unnamed protein product [Gongylonema pulchrum]|uniref:Uncharacterized protein n=1 Tax=Gongylonema pulchrum TaxID=637853 RepID=A0A183EDH9_9BILA|nr:unnamed protein product [Gongylonema pulchrum]